MKGEENNLFEALLGDALRDSVNTEPRTGLEQRILAHVRAEHVPFRYLRWWHMAVALPLIALAILVTSHQKELSSGNKPIEKAAVVVTPHGIEPSLMALSRTEVQSIAAPRKAVKAELPKQNVFPALTAPTVEDLRLAAWSHQYPQEASHLLQLQQADSTSEELKVEPIRIAAIEVPPLTN
jgi:hypothetical protein